MIKVDGKRLVSILQGEEAEVQYDLLLIPEEVDVDAERAAWTEWRTTKYQPARRTGNPIQFVTFAEWLLSHGAIEAEHEVIEAP
jgi:hypothetical protein